MTKDIEINKIIPLMGPLPRLPPPPAILTVQCTLHKSAVHTAQPAQPWRRRTNEPEEREYYFVKIVYYLFKIPPAQRVSDFKCL